MLEVPCMSGSRMQAAAEDVGGAAVLQQRGAQRRSARAAAAARVGTDLPPRPPAQPHCTCPSLALAHLLMIPSPNSMPALASGVRPSMASTAGSESCSEADGLFSSAGGGGVAWSLAGVMPACCCRKLPPCSIKSAAAWRWRDAARASAC